MKRLLGLIASFVVAGCAATCPSEDALDRLIMASSPEVRGVVEYVEIASFDEKQQCCPVEAKIVVGSTFGRNSIEVVNYCFHRTTNGVWAAKGDTGEAKIRPEKVSMEYEQAEYAIRVTLKWEDGSLNESGFEIERKTGFDGTYRQIAEVGPNVTTYSDSGLARGTVYYYRIRAYNSAGYSSFSDEVRFVAPDK